MRGMLLSLSLKPTIADMAVVPSTFSMITKHEVRPTNVAVAERLFALIMSFNCRRPLTVPVKVALRYGHVAFN